ncbi:class I SAM-dependent methyltransferase [Tumebacillus sp. DT12]|uniref:Class I SAM-dependent methyltransferase n=1 Tax=Tumebacillus lacus TaxID=2995335 RepID=A0ABT3WXN0_9BACL|nr:class I SAM-dependent methyltransferase [Tumebacillus lacus]MCX7569386.1 class I SAM-dependent methyltransferase [Tumebacillus lacus]
MDRNKFSAIAHRDHAFANPLSESKLMRMVEMLKMEAGQTVLDVGAGQGELLIRMAEQYGVRATAMELYEGAVSAGRQRAAGRVADDSVVWVQGDAGAEIERIADGSFDVGMCIGSTHALGGLVPTLQALGAKVKKGGYLLIGEGYWKQRPCSEYLEALGGADESELKSHAANVQTAEELGLVPLWSYVTHDEEWDEYEWLYSKSVEDYCSEQPDDPDRDAMLAKIRGWRRTYLTWGRDTLGFGLYLFRNE